MVKDITMVVGWATLLIPENSAPIQPKIHEMATWQKLVVTNYTPKDKPKANQPLDMRIQT